jgi:hypothetical protein
MSIDPSQVVVKDLNKVVEVLRYFSNYHFLTVSSLLEGGAGGRAGVQLPQFLTRARDHIWI